jgi:hypothetical protein
MTFKKSIKTQIEEAEEKIENCKEAKMLLDSAIKSTYLFDRHSLEIQKWIKEYNKKIEDLKNFLEGAYNE